MSCANVWACPAAGMFISPAIRQNIRTIFFRAIILIPRIRILNFEHCAREHPPDLNCLNILNGLNDLKHPSD
jgi:hypothetical protein